MLCKTGSQHACATTVTPMEIWTSYGCAVARHQCSAALVRVKIASLLFSAALQNKVTAYLCHCKNTSEYLRFIQVCSDATQLHCSTGQGKIASLLFSAALQTSLTACLCDCNHTCGDLLFIQVCSDASQVHCSTGQGNIASLLSSAALQTSLIA